MMNNNQKINKSLFCYVFLLALIIFQNCTTEISQKTSDVEEEKILLERVDEFNLAFKECNIEKLESMITNNYVHTNGSSKSIGKAAWVNYLKKRKKQIGSGDLVVENYEMTDTGLEMYDEIAILTATITAT